jgi:hypothetical protein
LTGGAGGQDIPRDRFGLPAPFGRLLYTWLFITAGLTVAFVYALRNKFTGVEAYFLLHHDLPVLVLMLAFVAALPFTPALAAPARIAGWIGKRPGWTAAAIAVFCCVLGAAAAPLLFSGYTLSLDEFLANFDAAIFAHGELMAPIAPQWQPFAPALQPLYMLPVPNDDFWASGYLPVNAGMRALASLGHLDWLVNPALSGFSIFAVYGVGRRLWPDRPPLALGAAVLMATSSQLILMSMTAYAMPAHLAFNLAWLWLFLRGGKIDHALAVVVGFFAAGIHQLLFHPVFVAPFVLQLWLDRRWRLASFYTLAYAAICAFWVAYWKLDMQLTGVSMDGAVVSSGGLFLDRIVLLVEKVQLAAVGQMGQSLLRFVTWQNPLTTPLFITGAFAAWRAKGHLRALLLGVVLTLVAMLIFVPTQTHGWGYRYLHGLLGSICLLAIWAWSWLTDPLPAPRRAAAMTAFGLACALSVLILLPVRAWQAWAYVRPYAAASAWIHSAPAQVVIVDHEGTPGFDPGTVIRNTPYLDRWPKVLALEAMDPDDVRQICARYSVMVFRGPDAALIGMDTLPLTVTPRLQQLRDVMAQLKCGAPMSKPPR